MCVCVSSSATASSVMERFGTCVCESATDAWVNWLFSCMYLRAQFPRALCLMCRYAKMSSVSSVFNSLLQNILLVLLLLWVLYKIIRTSVLSLPQRRVFVNVSAAVAGAASEMCGFLLSCRRGQLLKGNVNTNFHCKRNIQRERRHAEDSYSFLRATFFLNIIQFLCFDNASTTLHSAYQKKYAVTHLRRIKYR